MNEIPYSQNPVKLSLDWLDQRRPWQFIGVLYVVRWIVLAPISFLSRFVFTTDLLAAAAVPKEALSFNLITLFFFLVLIGPLVETLLECALLYFIFSRVCHYTKEPSKRRWGFIMASACFMALVHPMAAAMMPSLITGAFLAYCYAHFAIRSAGHAILETTCFHGAINLVGWSIIMVSRFFGNG